MTFTNPILFLLVFLLGAVNNWAIPLAIYAAKFGLFKKRSKDFIGCNAWGIVMDVVFAGLINVTILNFILMINPVITTDDIAKSLVIGFFIMVSLHLWMGITSWKEWIMLEPFHWNEGGYWHMVSATLQMGYAAFPIVLIFNKTEYLGRSITWWTFLMVAIFGFCFLWALSKKNKTVKLGPLTISHEPW